MKSLLAKLVLAGCVATVLVALALGAFLVWGLPALLPEGTLLVIDGEQIDLHGLEPAHPGHWLMASMGVLVAAAVIVVVVPLVMVLALGLPLLMSGVGLALALLAMALVMSPVILLVWWLWKDPKRTKNATTISS